MSDDLVARVERLADVASRRGGCDRVYRLSACRSKEDRAALWERMQRDDPFVAGPLGLITEVFGRGAIDRIEVRDFVDGKPVDLGGVAVLVKPERSRTGKCYWADDEGGDDGGENTGALFFDEKTA